MKWIHALQQITPQHDHILMNVSVFGLVKSLKLIFDRNFVADAVIREISRDLDIRQNMADRLRQLRDYEVVIVCDDSGSMRTPVDNSKRTRWDELCEIVKIVIKIGVVFDSNGVDIHFLNRPSFPNVKDPRVVEKVFERPPSGYTPLVPVLKRIFASSITARHRDKKVLVFVATDGIPTDNNGNSDLDEFRRCMQENRRIETTHVSFLLCTDEPECVEYMRKWDEEMDNVDVTDDFHTERDRIRQCRKNKSYAFSYGDYVVKALVGAIDAEMDALNEF